MNTALVGAAGVYFVAARLSEAGLLCAPTFGNAPGVDILVSNPEGSTSVSVQVKTAMKASRERGRGGERRLHHLEWDIGWRSARLRARDLFFALVNLHGGGTLPDIYIVPSEVVANYFDPKRAASSGWWSTRSRPDPWPRARYHELVEELEQYRNNWAPILNRLTELDREAT